MQQSNATVVAVARGKPIAVMPLDNQINSVAGTLYRRDGRPVKKQKLCTIDDRPKIATGPGVDAVIAGSGFQVGDIARPLP
jgi:hypothetical protein